MAYFLIFYLLLATHCFNWSFTHTQTKQIYNIVIWRDTLQKKIISIKMPHCLKIVANMDKHEQKFSKRMWFLLVALG